MVPLRLLQECNRGAPRSVGDICDCLIEGSWWEACRVVAVRNAKKAREHVTLEVVWGDERREVPLANSRSTLRLDSGRWQLCMLVGADGEAAGSGGARQQQQEEEKGSTAGKPQASKKPPKAAGTEARADGEAGNEGPSRKRRRKSKQQPAPAAAEGQAGAQVPATAPAADDQGEANEAPPTSAATAAAEAAAAAASAAEAAEAAGALMAAAASRPPTAAGKGGGRKSGAAPGASPSKKTPARATSAPYEVPDEFDASVLLLVDVTTVGSAKSSLPLAYARRFLALRRELPAEGEA